MTAQESDEIVRCANPDCRQPIEDDEIVVHGDEGKKFHMGCDIVEVYNEVGSGGFDRDG